MKTKGIYFLYRVLQALALPALVAYFLVRSLRNPAYFTSLPQRLGFLSRSSFRQTVAGSIWLHAVSVGEVLSIVELARRLRAEFPRTPVFVSTGTLAGRATAREKLGGTATGIFYAPIDHVFAIRRVLRMLQPAVVAVIETEIWPNLFRESKRAGCRLVIVNGRISDRMARRYRRLRWFFREVMHCADAVLVQSEAMRERYLAMGSPPERVRVSGNLKYDFVPLELDRGSPVRRFIERLQPAEVWIAASTMAPAATGDVDEDDAAIAAFRELEKRHSRLALVLAPRKPERFGAVAAKLERAGIRFVRRSDLNVSLELPGVLLLDSIGELSGLFPMAHVVFMGGTLALRGGHNILEPALFARPVICGPHMENFSEIAREFRAQGGLMEIDGPAALAGAVESLLANPIRAAEIGRAALDAAQAKRGATSRALDAIRTAAMEAYPLVRPPILEFAIFWPLARVWRWAGAWNRRRNLGRRRRLDACVISVGNITMGGTGKTPMVLYLADQMKRLGHRPGILTRGHGRHSLERHLILEPGARVGVTESGDEPQIFLRAGVAPVGIGRDRYETGRLLEQRFDVDVLLLDDGFQHLRLERQVDLVVIDALAPFGGGEVFPLGWLREPPEALARADVMVVTRSENGRMPGGLETRLRRYNAHAPIFYARAVPQCWVEEPGSREIPVAAFPFSRVGAFCGLGNPDSFWRTLGELGLEVADRVEFSDHHSYRPAEIRHLSREFLEARAQAAVTTGKDAVNLCESHRELMAPLPLYWLKMRTEMERETELLDFLERRLGATPRHFTARQSGSPTP